MTLVLRLALRYARQRRIALVAVLAVAVGVLALVVLTALMDGAIRFTRGHFRRTLGDLGVSAVSDPARWQVWSFTRPILEKHPEVVAASPRYETLGFAGPPGRARSAADDRDRAIRLVGIDFAREARVLPLEEMMGSVEDPQLEVPPTEREDPLRPGEDGRPKILLGDLLARSLGVSRAGGASAPSLLSVVSADVRERGEDGFTIEDQRERTFRVAGCFAAGHQEFDDNVAYVDRQVLREMLGVGAEATRVQVLLRDGADVDRVRDELEARHPELMISSWRDSPVFFMLADQKRVLALILSLVVLVACAAICGLIWMMVLEKVRDIGVLQSLGMSRSAIVGCFVAYGGVLAATGSALGLLAAIPITRNIHEVVEGLSGLLGAQVLNAAVYKFREVPVAVSPSAVIAIVGGTLGACLLASLLPGLRAVFLRPVDCLRSFD